MKVLFDQGTPAPLRQHLPAHQVDTAAEAGWSELTNGELLSQAEAAGYECLITTDQNLCYQQNLDGRRIAVAVLLSTSWPRIREKTEDVVAALSDLPSGGFVTIPI